jgi:hypothetical protein
MILARKEMTPVLTIAVFVVTLALEPPNAAAQDAQRGVEISFDEGWTQPPFLPPGDNNQQAMRLWAWKQFLALNWPAVWPPVANSRGQADTTKSLAKADLQYVDEKDKRLQSLPRVWETWVPKELVFLPQGKEPAPWSGQQPLGKHLGQGAKVHASFRPQETEIGEAVGGDLLDQNCNYLRFHVLINETMYSTLRDEKWYDAFEQLSRPPSPPGEDFVSFPSGSIEVKAAWKLLVLSQEGSKTDPALVGHTANCKGPKFTDEPGRYLTAKATVYREWDSATQTGTAPLEVTVGLVGIHIVTKDPNRPQRLWATFEQVDNVEILREYRGRGLRPSLFSPDAPAFDPQDPSTHDYRPNLRIHYQEDPDNPVPVQVTRELPIPEDVQRVNQAVRAQLKKKFPDAPWQYYQLIDIQFPSAPENRRDGNPIPRLLGNAAIETFNQTESSCVGCHSFARPVNKFELSDFSWIMGQANWPRRAIPEDANGRQLFAYMTQTVPYAQPWSQPSFPRAGPFYLTWKSFPDDKWNTYSGFMAGENPHGASTRIYINETAHKFASQFRDRPLSEDAPIEEFPVGSVILKENHRSWLPGNLVEFTAMLKREEGPDWYWLKASPSGKIWREGKADGCIHCHKQGNGNRLLSWNYGREPYRHNYATRGPLFPRPDVKQLPQPVAK